MLFLTICKQLSIKMLNWLSVSRDVRRRECPLMNGVWRFPLQDAGPSTTLLVRTMRSWAVSSSKPRILLAPWHSYNPMQGYEALWAEWHCQSEYCGARHDVQSRAGWPVRGYQSSPRPSNPSASIAPPAGEACYALLCPAMPCKCKKFVWKEPRTCERARPSKLIKSSFTHELLRRCAHCTGHKRVNSALKRKWVRNLFFKARECGATRIAAW